MPESALAARSAEQQPLVLAGIIHANTTCHGDLASNTPSRGNTLVFSFLPPSPLFTQAVFPPRPPSPAPGYFPFLQHMLIPGRSPCAVRAIQYIAKLRCLPTSDPGQGPRAIIVSHTGPRLPGAHARQMSRPAINRSKTLRLVSTVNLLRPCRTRCRWPLLSPTPRPRPYPVHRIA